MRRRPAPAAGNPTGPAAQGPQTPSSDPNAPGAAALSGDLANKLAIFTAERMGPRREAQQMAALTLSSNGVLASLQALERQESGAILIKIRDAAKTNGGIEAVLTEMRPGGAFEDLRHEFNAALAHDEGFARAYDYAAASLATYAQARAALDASPHLRPETSLARLESLDQEIVKAAAILPGGQDGKSALEEAFKGGREALEKAAAAIRATVSRDSDVRGPAASPSFGP